jgi:hypothetical protein
MNRARTWALVAGMAAGLVAGPGCMMFDEFCDDDCPYVCDREYPVPELDRPGVDPPLPGSSAQPQPAVPDR